jgi:hypothetical protein
MRSHKTPTLVSELYLMRKLTMGQPKINSILTKFVTGLTAGFLFVTAGVTDATAQQPDTEADVQELVEQLGSVEFQEREDATQQLIALRDKAISGLKENIRHTDPEIRLRTRRILATIKRLRRWEKVNEFAADTDGSKGTTLAGWPRFSKIAGDSPDARQVFVSMYKIDQELMSLSGEDPEAAAQLLPQRSTALQQTQNLISVADAISLTSVLLFVAGNGELEISNTTLDSQLYSACLQSKFASAVNGSDKKDIYRNLMGNWVAKSTGYRQIKLALRYNLPQGVEGGRRLLERGNAISSLYRQYAILAIAKTGKPEDSVILEKLLDDRLKVGGHTVNGKRYDVELRDVALAGIIHMHGQDPKKFGFDRLVASTSYLFSRSTLGFKDDEARAAALAKWQNFINPQPPEPEIPPPPAPDLEKGSIESRVEQTGEVRPVVVQPPNVAR